MAKLYDFRISVQKAEFKDGLVSVLYGPRDTLTSYRVIRTLDGALKELQAVSDKYPGPHVAFLSMSQASDRKPPGFKDAKKRIEKP